MLNDLRDAVGRFGLFVRGGFEPEPRDNVPPLRDWRETRAVVLVGSAGPAMWRHFQEQRPAGPDPLDRWTAHKLREVSARFGASAVFPFDRPFLPFQRWLRRTEPCRVSPLRILIHPEYGLWHAMRGALLFGEPVDLPAKLQGDPPCKGCAGRPCMTACPVDAFSARGLDTARCAKHLASPEGRDCMLHGCLARRACHVGRAYQHGADQAAFHMSALLDGHTKAGARAEAASAR